MIETVSSLDGYTTLKAAGERFAVSPEAVYGWVLRHGYPVKRLGRTLLIREQDIKEYRKDKQTGGARTDLQTDQE